MAIDENFLLFIIPALIVGLAALAALPSKGRIEKDPSTAFKRGKRTFVNGATGFALIMGLILALVGGTQNVKAVVDGVNMIQIGGISLLAMSVVLIVASIQIRRMVKEAGRGTHEMVVEVDAIGVEPVPSNNVHVEFHDDRLPPRPDPYGRPPVDGERVRMPPPPPRRPPKELPRDAPGHDGMYRGPPPPRAPPRRRPPPG
jgi:hypothetical protein